MRKTTITALALFLILAQGSLLHGDEAESIPGKARLQKALFAEEAERDLAKAAKEYELLVENYTEARQLGLVALYRLAEVRRKQNRNEEAAKLYLRVFSEFPETPEARMSRENLTALGVGLPAAPTRIPEGPAETKELRRLMMLARNSPGKIWDEVPLALDDTGRQTTSPLSKAARQGWLRVVSYLAEQHKKAGRKQRELDLALYSAAEEGQVESCRLLVKHGATLELAKNSLVGAILNYHQAVGDWLLEEGVDINTVASGRLLDLENRKHFYSGRPPVRKPEPYLAYTTFTPLAAAIATDDPEWIDRLLKLGADVNFQGTEDSPAGISPLSLACWKGHGPLVKRLLDLGADPNHADQGISRAEDIRQPPSEAEGWRPLHYAAGKPKIIAMLLAAGADPQGADAEGLTPLHAAAYLNSVESCQILLETGVAADPAAKLSWLHDQKWTPLFLACSQAKPEDGGASAKKIVEILRQKGAAVAPQGFPRDLMELCPAIPLRIWLTELIRYPELARTGGITIAFPVGLASQPLVPRPEKGGTPPSLAESLLKLDSYVSVIGNHDYPMERGFIRRADAEGGFQKIPFEVLDLGTHPELQWGDLIEFNPSEMDSPAYVAPWPQKDAVNRSPRGVYTSVSFQVETYVKLYAQLERQISIVWPDRRRQELTLRGALRVYDPSRAEAPLISPKALVKLLGGFQSQTLQIVRSKENGGETIEVPQDEEATAGIRFLEGDVMTVGAIDPVKMKEFRSKNIQLVEPESGFSWALSVPADGESGYDQRGSEEKSLPSKYPTLFQFLTNFYLPLETFELQTVIGMSFENEDYEKWKPEEVARAVELSGVTPWATIRHPDLSEIWIERLDGERIRFSLAELIAKTNAETPEEFHRSADLELQAGDIVELRVLPNHEKKPWKGFDPEAVKFIEKALSYDIVVAPVDKSILSRKVTWKTPRWFETSVGPIAVGNSEHKPFLMAVGEVGRAVTGRKFKWGLDSRWLRQKSLIEEAKGRSSLVEQSRMGGADFSFYYRHGGLGGRTYFQGFGRRDVRPKSPSSGSRVPLPIRKR